MEPESIEQTNRQNIIRPSQDSFLFYGVLKVFLPTFVVLLVLYIVFYSILELKAVSFLYFVGSMIALGFLMYIHASASFRKEQYSLLNDRFIVKGGGLFSNFERELAVHNVTRVTLLLPFIENNLFATGSIKVESAGAAETEVHIRSVKDSERIYEQIIDLMKRNGFQLSRQELIQEERPHTLAVFFEVFRNFFVGISFALYLLLGLIEDESFDFHAFMGEYSLIVLFAGAILLLGMLGYSLLNFLDLKRRIYNLYADAVEYKEGFLNKKYSVIPIENLADSSITQTFVSKIFGLYDIKLSCQGAAQEILFKNIKNGEKLSSNIDKVISQFQQKKKKESPPAARSDASGAQKPVIREVVCDREFSGEYKMNGFRVWLPFALAFPLWLLAFPLGIILAIMIGIRYSNTKYRIKSDSVQRDYSFLSRTTQEFSFDKVTGILIKKSILDHILRTATVLFWSIGSDKNISFDALKFDSTLKDAMLGKKGIKPQDKLYSLKSECNPIVLIQRNLYVYLFLFIPVVALAGFFLGAIGFGTLCMVYLLFVGYKILYYRQSKMDFYEDYVHYSEGLINKVDYYVLYDDVKDITTTSYPGTRKGQILFNVAGETMRGAFQQYQAQTQLQSAQKKAALARSNGFTIPYVKGIDVLDEMIDKIFYERPGKQAIEQMMEKPVDTSLESSYSSKPSLANYLFGPFLFLLIFEGLSLTTLYSIESSTGGTFHPGYVMNVLVFNVVLLIPITIYVKSITYRIQPYRVLRCSGVLFKKQTSVTFNKIDFINIKQNAVNKLFGSGNITVNTVGSSKPELNIRYLKDYRSFYEQLKKNYQ